MLLSSLLCGKKKRAKNERPCWLAAREQESKSGETIVQWTSHRTMAGMVYTEYENRMTWVHVYDPHGWINFYEQKFA